MAIVAFDPGRNVGVAYVSQDGELLEHRIVELRDVPLLDLPRSAAVVVGGGTGRRQLVAALRTAGHDPVVVDERSTTLEAKDLYYQRHPPRGWVRLLPRGMRTPPVPLDDYAAYAIALRWLAEQGRPEPG